MGDIKDIGTILTIAALVVAVMFLMMVIVIVQLMKLKAKYKAFLGTSDAIDVETVLKENQNAIQNIIEREAIIEENIKIISNNLEKTFEKMAIIKYNAFDGMGGQMSAVIALLNKKGNGYLINSIHTNSGNHMYVKEIVNKTCEQTLSNEEETAIKKAMTN